METEWLACLEHRSRRLLRLAAAQQASTELGRRAVDKVETKFFRLLADGLARGKLGEAEHRYGEDVWPSQDCCAERQPERRADPRGNLRRCAVEGADAEGVVRDLRWAMMTPWSRASPSSSHTCEPGWDPLSIEAPQRGQSFQSGSIAFWQDTH